VIGGGGALLLYAICAKLLGIDEFRVLVRSVAGRLGRLRLTIEIGSLEIAVGSAGDDIVRKDAQ